MGFLMDSVSLKEMCNSIVIVLKIVFGLVKVMYLGEFYLCYNFENCGIFIYEYFYLFFIWGL